MKPCFVSTPLLLNARSSSPAVCAPKRAVAPVRMAAAEGDGDGQKKQSFGDWLLSKIMHNQDAAYGFEPFHKEAMSAREDKQKRVYTGTDKDEN